MQLKGSIAVLSAYGISIYIYIGVQVFFEVREGAQRFFVTPIYIYM